MNPTPKTEQEWKDYLNGHKFAVEGKITVESVKLERAPFWSRLTHSFHVRVEEQGGDLQVYERWSVFGVSLTRHEDARRVIYGVKFGERPAHWLPLARRKGVPR